MLDRFTQSQALHPHHHRHQPGHIDRRIDHCYPCAITLGGPDKTKPEITFRLVALPRHIHDHDGNN